MMKIIRWVWQLPQNLLGLMFIRTCTMKSARKVRTGKWVSVWFKPLSRPSVCLGDYIVLNNWYRGRIDPQVVGHVYGHQRQSLILGWLYLPLVGLPVVCRCLWGRLFHRNWSDSAKVSWHYRGYPERWADLLGWVVRD